MEHTPRVGPGDDLSECIAEELCLDLLLRTGVDRDATVSAAPSWLRRARELLRRLDMETEAQVLHRYQQAATEGTEYEEFDPLEMDRYLKPGDVVELDVRERA